MIQRMLSAVADPKPWLAKFDRYGYEEAFQAYQDQYAALYREAVQAAGETGLDALADALLDAVAASWKQLRFWDRSAARVETKQVIVGYLTPMLLEEPELRPFAAALRDRWKARWPRDAYHAAGYDRIRSGFKLKIMGFEIPEKKERPVDDDI